MKILFISSFLLFKETHFGGAKRLYNFAEVLNKTHDLSIIMLDACKEIAFFKENRIAFSNTFIFTENNRMNLFSKCFYLPWDISYYIRKNNNALNNFLSKKSFDAVLVAFPIALSLIKVLPKSVLKNVSYLEDDLYIRGLQALLQKIHNPIKKAILFIRIQQTKCLYRKSLEAISRVFFISEQEKEKGKIFFPGKKAHIISYGISLSDYTFIADKKMIPVVGFIGNYNHVPNKDAVEHFVSVLFPHIFSHIPEIKIVIAGKNTPDIWSKQNFFPDSVSYINEVHDLNAFYRTITLFINPIVSGGGMRTKLIEAAACGVPIVSTRLGAEGLANLKIAIAETGLEFVEKIKKLYLNKEHYSEIAKYNRTIVENNYTIEIIGKKLESVLLE